MCAKLPLAYGWEGSGCAVEVLRRFPFDGQNSANFPLQCSLSLWLCPVGVSVCVESSSIELLYLEITKERREMNQHQI